jgi:hypothetical protein
MEEPAISRVDSMRQSANRAGFAFLAPSAKITHAAPAASDSFLPRHAASPPRWGINE